MKFRPIHIDENAKEIFNYTDISFPMELWSDEYEKMEHHTLACHWHEDFEFGIVLSGSVEYHLGDQCCILTTGDCVFVNRNILHWSKQSEKSSSSAHMAVLTFLPTLLVSDSQSSLFQKLFGTVRNTAFSGCFMTSDTKQSCRIRDELYFIKDVMEHKSNYELSCIAALCNIWDTFLEYYSSNRNLISENKETIKHQEEIKKILLYIQTHYMESFTIAELSKKIGISRSECFRLFKSFTKQTPIEYINDMRLNNAAHLLQNTNFSVTEIATKCGFSDISYFGKLFKHKYSVSPLKYRNL